VTIPEETILSKEKLFQAQLEENQKNLETATGVMLSQIFESLEKAPRKLRILAHCVFNLATLKWPNFGSRAVGALLFLRFICPTLLTGNWYLGDELQEKAQRSKVIRRNLLLVTKVVQNLANRVKFGAKEQFLVPLNSFLEANIFSYEKFCYDFANPDTPCDYPSSIPNGKTALYHYYTEKGVADDFKLLQDTFDSVTSKS